MTKPKPPSIARVRRNNKHGRGWHLQSVTKIPKSDAAYTKFGFTYLAIFSDSTARKYKASYLYDPRIKKWVLGAN